MLDSECKVDPQVHKVSASEIPAGVPQRKCLSKYGTLNTDKKKKMTPKPSCQVSCRQVAARILWHQKTARAYCVWQMTEKQTSNRHGNHSKSDGIKLSFHVRSQVGWESSRIVLFSHLGGCPRKPVPSIRKTLLNCQSSKKSIILHRRAAFMAHNWQACRPIGVMQHFHVRCRSALKLPARGRLDVM